MTCNIKTILRIGLGAAAILAIAYLAFPQLRPLLLSASPSLLFLLCPISMMLMIRQINPSEQQARSKEQQ